MATSFSRTRSWGRVAALALLSLGISGCGSAPGSQTLLCGVSQRLLLASSALVESLYSLFGAWSQSPRQDNWLPVVSAPTVLRDAEHCQFQGQDFFLLLIFAAVILTAVRSRRATIRQRLELARLMAERGLEPPQELMRAGVAHDLHRGIVLLATGFGFLLAAYFAQVPGLSPAGLIPICIGIGYMVSHRMSLQYQREQKRGE